jgi:hypothetical protein
LAFFLLFQASPGAMKFCTFASISI